MASTNISLCLFITKLISTMLVFCVVFVASARRVNPHRFHNKLFHPEAQRDHHRTRRGDCQEDDWEAMSFAGRIAHGDSDAILQGTVDRLLSYPGFSRPYQGRGIYLAEVTVECLYKGWGHPDRVNITGFGETNDCVRTDVSVGISYIFLVNEHWTQLSVSEFNLQSGAVVATRYSESTVRSFYPCRLPFSSPVSYYLDSSSYSTDLFSSPDYASGVLDYYSGIESEPGAVNLCPAYDFFSFISMPLYGGDYYDYDKDGYLDYCRFLNTAVLRNQPNELLLTIAIASSSLNRFL